MKLYYFSWHYYIISEELFYDRCTANENTGLDYFNWAPQLPDTKPWVNKDYSVSKKCFIPNQLECKYHRENGIMGLQVISALSAS